MSNTFFQPVIISAGGIFSIDNQKLADLLGLNLSDLEITNITADKTQSISIDQIRSMITESYKKNITGKIRVFILQDAQDMKDVAQNSMLKILEEPNQDVILVLYVNDISEILPTIISRCRVIKIKKTQENKFNIDNEDYLLEKILDKENKNQEKLSWKDEKLRLDMIELQCLSNVLENSLPQDKLAKFWLANLWEKELT